MKPTIERRYIPADELRATTADGKTTLRGHSAVFNVLSEDLGGFREDIAPGAFANTIKADDVRALWNHNADYVLGRMKSRTLTLSEDEKGLFMENAVPDTQWARDLVVSIDRGDVSQQSFGFSTVADKWETRGGKNFRTLLEVKLFDVSPVTFPAYPATDVQARALMLEAADVDSDLFFAALVRGERALPLEPGDDEVLRKAAERLTALAHRRTLRPGTQEHIAAMHRELDLALAGM